MRKEYDLENIKKNIKLIYMPVRKHTSGRSKLRKTKTRRTKRGYGKKRGGFLQNLNMFKSESKEQCMAKCEKKAENNSPAPTNPSQEEQENKNLNLAEQGQMQPEMQQPNPEGENMTGGKRRRRRASRKRSSKKSKKVRRTRRRKHRGGSQGYTFQPSVVTPPNSALATPMPFASYNRMN